MTARRQIYPVPRNLDAELVRHLQSLKEQLEIISGVRGGKIARMTDTQERWKDQLTDLSSGRVAGANTPTWAAFVGGISAYSFSATLMNEMWFNIHIPHEFRPGTRIYPHVHWSVLGTNTGTVRWGFEYTVAKGHAMAGFGATQTVYVEQAYPGQTGGAPTHMIAEVSDANAIAYDFEPDTVVMFRLFRDAANVADTQTAAAFAFYADIHFQSDENETTTRFPVDGRWAKNEDEHAPGTIAKVNEILQLLQVQD